MTSSSDTSINYLNDFNESKISDFSLYFKKTSNNNLSTTFSSLITLRVDDSTESLNAEKNKKLLKLDEFINIVKNEFQKTRNLDLLLENQDLKRNHLLACSTSKLDIVKRPLKKQPARKIDISKQKEQEKAHKLVKVSNFNKPSVGKQCPHNIANLQVNKKDSSKIIKKTSKSLAERLKSVYLNSSNALIMKKNPNANNNNKKSISKEKPKETSKTNSKMVKKSFKTSSLNINNGQQKANLKNKAGEKNSLTKKSTVFQRLSKDSKKSSKKFKEIEVKTVKSKSLLNFLTDDMDKINLKLNAKEKQNRKVSQDSFRPQDSLKEFVETKKYFLNELKNDTLDGSTQTKSEEQVHQNLSNETIKLDEEINMTPNEPEKIDAEMCAYKDIGIDDDIDVTSQVAMIEEKSIEECKSRNTLKSQIEDYKLESMRSTSSLSTVIVTDRFRCLNTNEFVDRPFEKSTHDSYYESENNSSAYETSSQLTNLNQIESKMKLEQLEKEIEKKKCESAVNNALHKIFTFHKSVLKDYFKANENDTNINQLNALFDKEEDQNWKVFICLPSLYDKHGNKLIDLFKKNNNSK